MKSALVTTGFALALLAGSVAANAASTAPDAAKTTPSYAAPVISDADAMRAADQLHHTSIRQQLQDQLAKAGYSSINITPSSFFVQAKDKNGDSVEMVIGPDSFTEVTDINQKSPGHMAQQTPEKTPSQK